MYSENLQKGDLVIVAHNNRMTAGIYFGRGQNDTFQYYPIWDNVDGKGWGGEACIEWYSGVILADKRKPYKSYVTSTHGQRFAKLSLDNIKPSLAQTYTSVKQLLTDTKFI